MFSGLLKQTILKPLLARKSPQKRKHDRRAKDHCVIEMNGQNFPVKDWSYGGVLLTADERMFATDQAVNFTLKFRMPDTIKAINHRGHVVRKTKQSIALQFEPLTRDLRHSFQIVVESVAA